MLSGESLTEFRAQTWHKKPAVFRSAIDVSGINLSTEAICRATNNDLVESRMINNQDFSLAFGPFDFVYETSSSALLPDHQMLLVQCIEQIFPSIDQLLKTHFAFLPRWQIDDVMASVGYAGATCGAHFDHYDVFLFQFRGTKQWTLDSGQHTDKDLRDDVDIRLLRQFNDVERHTLYPGDVLYLPPGVGHCGVCGDGDGDGAEDSVTLSVGVRNPNIVEFITDLSEFLLQDTSDTEALVHDLFEFDSGIPAGAMQTMTARVRALFTDQASLANCYGCYVTRLREPDWVTPLIEDYTNDTIAPLARNKQRLIVSLPSRLCFDGNTNQCNLYANGEMFELPGNLLPHVKALVLAREIQLGSDTSSPLLDLVTSLMNAGVLTLANASTKEVAS